jgi:two-component system LytT family response regulator
MEKIKALVIDDEYLNRDLITKLVHRIDSNFQIIGEAENITDAFELIKSHKPDLIFLDIKMPGGNGFELLNRFAKPDFEVVFITGFDEYAIQAFEYNALDYVLKPIDPFKFKNTLERVRERVISKLSIVNNLKEILETYNKDYTAIVKIPIHYQDQVVLLNVDEIISIEANAGYTIFKIGGNEELMSSKQLVSFEFIIDKFSNFVRISKGVYINIEFIKNYSKGSVCFITLKNNQVFEVSRRKKTEILMLLDKGMTI